MRPYRAPRQEYQRGRARNEKDHQMNDRNNGSRGRRGLWRGRLGGVLAATAGFGLLVAACGGSPAPTTPKGPQQALQQALAYSRCMRAKGIATFPDPTQISSGAAQNSNG